MRAKEISKVTQTKCPETKKQQNVTKYIFSDNWFGCKLTKFSNKRKLRKK